MSNYVTDSVFLGFNRDPLVGLPAGITGMEAGCKWLIKKQLATLDSSCSARSVSGGNSLLLVGSGGGMECYAAAADFYPLSKVMYALGDMSSGRYLKTDIDCAALTSNAYHYTAMAVIWDVNTSKFVCLARKWDFTTSVYVRHIVDPVALTVVEEEASVFSGRSVINPPINGDGRNVVVHRNSKTYWMSDTLIYPSRDMWNYFVYCVDDNNYWTVTLPPHSWYDGAMAWVAADDGRVLVIDAMYNASDNKGKLLAFDPATNAFTTLSTRTVTPHIRQYGVAYARPLHFGDKGPAGGVIVWPTTQYVNGGFRPMIISFDMNLNVVDYKAIPGISGQGFPPSWDNTYGDFKLSSSECAFFIRSGPMSGSSAYYTSITVNSDGTLTPNTAVYVAPTMFSALSPYWDVFQSRGYAVANIEDGRVLSVSLAAKMVPIVVSNVGTLLYPRDYTDSTVRFGYKVREITHFASLNSAMYIPPEDSNEAIKNISVLLSLLESGTMLVPQGNKVLKINSEFDNNAMGGVMVEQIFEVSSIDSSCVLTAPVTIFKLTGRM